MNALNNAIAALELEIQSLKVARTVAPTFIPQQGIDSMESALMNLKVFKWCVEG